MSESVTPSTLTVLLDAPYWQFWSAGVVEIDLNQKCANSLIGPRAIGLGRNLPLHEEITVNLPAPRGLIAWYTCGVSVFSVLSKNTHMMTIPAPGETAFIEWDWGWAVQTNARQIPITDRYIDPRHSKATDSKFLSCRNWQAAWMIKNWIKTNGQEPCTSRTTTEPQSEARQLDSLHYAESENCTSSQPPLWQPTKP